MKINKPLAWWFTSPCHRVFPLFIVRYTHTVKPASADPPAEHDGAARLDGVRPAAASKAWPE